MISEKSKANKKAYSKNYDKTNLKRIAYLKAYQKEHGKEYAKTPQRKAYLKKYNREHYRKNPQTRWYRILHARVWEAMFIRKNPQAIKKLIGCDIEFFKGYIQAQFKSGMTWENYGTWNIDRIMPCRNFDLTDPEQQKLCFNYTNCQPLWAEENRLKYHESKVA